MILDQATTMSIATAFRFIWFVIFIMFFQMWLFYTILGRKKDD